MTSHLGATLQDVLDGRLDAERLAGARAHLDGCPQCRAELDALRWVRDVALQRLPGVDVPPGLATRITADRDAADEGTRRRWMRWAGAGALIAAAIAALLLFSPTRSDLPNVVARDYTAFTNGRLVLGIRSPDGAAIERFFIREGIAFPTSVFDLGMMQYELVGGRVHRLHDRPSALFAYRGPDGRALVCQMYEGRLADLPRTNDVREHQGVVFQVYRAGNLTLVFWQDGSVVCVLASDGDSEAVIQLAYAKAVRA